MKVKMLLVSALFFACSGPSPKTVSQCTDSDLGIQLLHTMEIVRAPLPKIQRQFLAQDLIRIAHDNFTTCDSKISWFTLLGIESKFDQSAKSPAGAIGIGQLMPQFAAHHGRLCGITNLSADDLRDRTINATVSACLFRHLLETVPNHSTTLALVAYNSGLNSSSSKNIKGLGALQNEPAQYVTRFTYVRELTNTKVTPLDVKARP